MDVVGRDQHSSADFIDKPFPLAGKGRVAGIRITVAELLDD